MNSDADFLEEDAWTETFREGRESAFDTLLTWAQSQPDVINQKDLVAHIINLLVAQGAFDNEA